MAVYVDGGRLIASTPEEMRQVAGLISVPPEHHHGDYCEVDILQRRLAITAGAQEVSRRQLSYMALNRRRGWEMGDPNTAEKIAKNHYKIERYRGDPWLLVKTQPRREQWAQENVERQGAETFLPFCLENKKVVVMFNSYLFVRRPGGGWWFLKGTFGVATVMMLNEATPIRISHKEIALLQARSNKDGVIHLPKKELVIGQRVQITHGPMIYQAGIYEGMTGRERVSILLDTFGRVSVDERSVEAY